MCGWVGLWLTPRERIDYPPGRRERGGGWRRRGGGDSREGDVGERGNGKREKGKGKEMKKREPSLCCSVFVKGISDVTYVPYHQWFPSVHQLKETGKKQKNGCTAS